MAIIMSLGQLAAYFALPDEVYKNTTPTTIFRDGQRLTVWTLNYEIVKGKRNA